MPSVAEMPSLIDDADFLAELDKLETAPKLPQAPSAFWEQASSVDEAAEGRAPAGLLAPPAPAPELAPVRRARSGKPVRPVRLEKRLKLETPGRIEMPFRPDGPARTERPVHDKRPVRPVHVDEIGESGRTRESMVTAVSAPLPRRVPASVAALTVVLCFCAGAGSAAAVFQDRVAQIVVMWKK